MADRVHHALALDDEAHVEIGDEDPLALSQGRREMAPLRGNDRRHGAAAQRLLQAFVRRDRGDLLFPQPTGRVDDEAATFQRMVADRHLDLLGEDRPDERSGKLGNVDFLVLRHQRVARERIIVFPAGERADPADRRLSDRQARAVALSPDHALVKSRRDLAPLELERAVGVEDEPFGVTGKTMSAPI